MEREVIYDKAKALKETLEKIESPDIDSRMIVDSCNTLIREAKEAEKDNLIDLKEVSWNSDTDSADKAEIEFNLSQILAIFKKEWGVGA